MAKGDFDYEGAFADRLRCLGWPCVRVDEQKKAVFSGARVKSFDFLVYRPDGEAWLVDVKGRHFPYLHRSGRRYWENWVTQEDIDGLLSWEQVFGDGFTGVFVFVYGITDPADPKVTGTGYLFRDRLYLSFAIDVQAYAQFARVRSSQWGTVSLPTATFRRLIRPAFDITATTTPAPDPQRGAQPELPFSLSPKNEERQPET